MVYALVGLVVLALVVFFILRKPAAPQSRSSHEVGPTTARSPEIDTPKGEAAHKTPSVGSNAPQARKEAALPIEDKQLDGGTSVPSGADDEALSDDTEELPLDDAHDDSGSPPPPPNRSSGTPVPQSVGHRAELQSLRKGLAKSRQAEGFFGRLKVLLGGRKEIDPEIASEIEEVLLTSDVGVATTEAILDRIKEKLSRGDLKNEAQVWDALRDEARRTLSVDGRSGGIVLRGNPTVILMVGVNGAGKTTTIGKLAQQLSSSGKKVMLAAGDTFRAAAVDQLKAWGERVGCEVIAGRDNADPSSVLFDAIAAARDGGADVLLADTAGRLHTKTNLMQEMSKIEKTAAKALAGAPHEVLLVIDSTNGQNAMAQAREFKEALNITGLVLTKLDGTARGGAVLGICDALQLPVRYIGVGERTEDLYEFDTDSFVEALLGSEKDEIAA